MSDNKTSDATGGGQPLGSNNSDQASEAALKGGKEPARRNAECDWKDSAQESGE